MTYVCESGKPCLEGIDEKVYEELKLSAHKWNDFIMHKKCWTERDGEIIAEIDGVVVARDPMGEE